MIGRENIFDLNNSTNQIKNNHNRSFANSWQKWHFRQQTKFYPDPYSGSINVYYVNFFSEALFLSPRDVFCNLYYVGLCSHTSSLSLVVKFHF